MLVCRIVFQLEPTWWPMGADRVAIFLLVEFQENQYRNLPRFSHSAVQFNLFLPGWNARADYSKFYKKFFLLIMLSARVVLENSFRIKVSILKNRIYILKYFYFSFYLASRAKMSPSNCKTTVNSIRGSWKSHHREQTARQFKESTPKNLALITETSNYLVIITWKFRGTLLSFSCCSGANWTLSSFTRAPGSSR